MTTLPDTEYPGAMHIGIDFVDADGKRVTSCQLLEHGKSIASAAFRDNKLYHLTTVDLVNVPLFLGLCSKLMARSTPQVFRATPLP